MHRRHALLPRETREKTKTVSPPPFPAEADGLELFWHSLKKQFFSLEDYQTLLGRLEMGEDTLQERLWREVALFERVTRELYPLAQPSADEVVLLPSSVDLQVIFRYVHPKDGPQTREEAYMAIQEAYRRLKEGEEFSEVAKESLEGGVSIRKLVKAKGLLKDQEIDEILDPSLLVDPEE